MKIQILGTGCTKCNKLAENAKEAAEQLGVDYEIEKIEEIEKITEMGVLMTPALAIDGKVKVSGKLISSKEIVKLLE